MQRRKWKAIRSGKYDELSARLAVIQVHMRRIVDAHVLDAA